MEPHAPGIYTLNSEAHHRGLYDPKSFHQTLSSATDFDCTKDLDIEDSPYCYKRPNGSLDLYEEVDRNPCRQFFKTWKGVIRKTTLTLAVVLYATLGGLIFSHVEGVEETNHNALVERWRNETAILLAMELKQVKPTEDIWAKTVFKYLSVFERDLMKAYQRGYRRAGDPMKGQQWNFGGGMAFSISAMTGTVYGTATPHSAAGRVLFPIYAVLGIPLAFVWLLTAGSLMADSWTFMVLRLCCCLTRPSTPRKICPLHQPPNEERHSTLRTKSAPAGSKILYGKSSLPRTCNSDRMLGLDNAPYRPERPVEIQENSKTAAVKRWFKCPVEFLVPNVEYQIVIVVFAILVFVVYFVVGTAIISLRTEWTFSESLSFTVAMLTTRGVGDFEPGLGENLGFAMALKQDMGMIFYYILGLCFLSTIGSLVFRTVTFKKRRKRTCK